MTKENISQDFRVEYIEKARYYFIEEVDLNEMMNKKHKRIFTTLN